VSFYAREGEKGGLGSSWDDGFLSRGRCGQNVNMRLLIRRFECSQFIISTILTNA
jgi:hypothetical protein